MNKTLRGYIAGFLTSAILISGVSYAANTVRIILDGKELIAKDADGSRVYPIIVDGTTYLPVRAVANAFGKAVYWDGPNYTVYLGDMDGGLEYPSVEIGSVDNIGNGYFGNVSAGELTDNYGNSYSYAHLCNGTFGGSKGTFQTLLNMKYSRFKCTLYVPKGYSADTIGNILIKTDGKTIYSSPEITKTSAPIDVDIDITGCNDFQIEFTHGRWSGYIADAGFYQ